MPPPHLLPEALPEGVPVVAPDSVPVSPNANSLLPTIAVTVACACLDPVTATVVVVGVMAALPYTPAPAEKELKGPPPRRTRRRSFPRPASWSSFSS